MSFEGGGHGAGEGSLHDRRSGSDNGGGGDGGRINMSVSGNSAGGDGGRIDRREQGLKITLAIHAVYLAFIGLMYVVIQIRYQNQGNSPFETHMAMKSSVVALCVYFCAAALKIKLVQSNTKLDYSGLLNHVLDCSGILCPLSNAMVFLPNMVGCIVVALFVFATTILLAYDVYKLISKCISKRNNSETNYAATTFEPVASKSTGICDNATTSESGEMNNKSSMNNNNAETTSESGEMNNESNRNNNDAVEIRINVNN